MSCNIPSITKTKEGIINLEIGRFRISIVKMETQKDEKYHKVVISQLVRTTIDSEENETAVVKIQELPVNTRYYPVEKMEFSYFKQVVIEFIKGNISFDHFEVQYLDTLLEYYHTFSFDK